MVGSTQQKSNKGKRERKVCKQGQKTHTQEIKLIIKDLSSRKGMVGKSMKHKNRTQTIAHRMTRAVALSLALCIGSTYSFGGVIGANPIYKAYSGEITTYAAVVGDAVTADMQTDINGTVYPADGSTVSKVFTSGTAELLVFNDGTAVLHKAGGGTGAYATASYTYSSNQPWSSATITTLIIDGEASLSENAFSGKTGIQLYFKGDRIANATYGKRIFDSATIMNDSLTIDNTSIDRYGFIGCTFNELVVKDSKLSLDGGSSNQAGAFRNSTIDNLVMTGTLRQYGSSYSETTVQNYGPFYGSTISNVTIDYLTDSTYGSASLADRFLCYATITSDKVFDNTSKAGRARWALMDAKKLYLTNPNLSLGADGAYQLYGYKGAEIYLLGDISDSSFINANLPTTINWHVKDGSKAKAALESAGRSFTVLTAEEINQITNGTEPTLNATSVWFDGASPANVNLGVTLGTAPAGATAISKVMVGTKTLSASDYSYNGTSLLTINSSYLATLDNGTYSISVLFNNGTFKTGASLLVLNSTATVVITDPPEALTTIKYEFYKDYPDYLIIPVKLNSATGIDSLKIGDNIVPTDSYELQDGALIISPDYLSTLDAGKYRVIPKFDDAKGTIISNIQLSLFENVADRAAPYLLQTRIVFDGSPVTMKYSNGVGDLEANGVLALVLDEKMILPNGEMLDYTSSNISALQTAFNTVFNADDLTGLINDPVASPSEATPVDEENTSGDTSEETVATPSEASPSEATMLEGMAVQGSFFTVMSNMFTAFGSLSGSQLDMNTLMLDSYMGNLSNSVFSVDSEEITLDGDYIKSLNLKEGDHLIGAIFDNTEKTNDLKKVILTIASSGGGTDNGGTDNGGTKPDPTPDNGNTDNGGSTPVDNGSSSGGSSGGSTGNGGAPIVEDKTPTGYTTDTKPTVPNDGGSFTVDPTDPTKVKYVDKDGNDKPDSWVGDGQDWFRTDANSYLRSDWYLDGGTGSDEVWYYLNRDTTSGKYGSARYNWHFESRDNHWYYLDPTSTKMVKGWNTIDGKEYYFTETNGGQTYFGDNDNGWVYQNELNTLPLGCLVVSGTTPDGSTVGADGAKIY